MDDVCKYNQYFSFIQSYRHLALYSVDLNLLKSQEIQYPRDYEIDENEFLENLYVKRSQEQEITDALLQTPNVILLIGEKGSGKTCLCLNLTRELKDRTSPRTLVISFDIRLEGFSLPITSLEPAQIDLELLDKLREKYLEQVFPYKNVEVIRPDGTKTFENPLIRLVAYIIDPYERKPRGYEFESLSIELRLLYEENLANRSSGGVISYYDWLIAEHLRDERIKNFIKDLYGQKKLKVSFLMHATHALYDYERQCIWIDNVDNLPTPHQARVQTIIKRLTSNISQIANVVVPVRDKNVFKQYEYDEFQAPPHQTHVRLFTPDRDEVPALEITKISMLDVKEIIRRRLVFAYKRQNNLVDEGRINSQSLIDTSTYENITQLSEKILEVWDNIQAPYLANNSIRALLIQHSDFITYLITSAVEKHKRVTKAKPSGNSTFPDFSAYTSRGVTTEYLAWLRRSNKRENTIGFYDVIADKDAWFESDKTQIGCTLEHLIITGIWNLTLRKPIYDSHSYKMPTVGRIVEKLEDLGYERSKILQVMASLFHENEIRTHFIEIQSEDIPLTINNPDEIKDSFTVYVTSRGKSISRYAINTFGYFFECVLNNLRRQNSSEVAYFTGYLNIDEKKAVDIMLPHLYQLAQMHLVSLRLIRDSKNSYIGRDWFNKYLDDFGIPINDNSSIGLVVGGRKKSLQFETMLDGIIKFTQHEENVSHLKALLKLFNESLDSIQEYRENGIDPLLTNPDRFYEKQKLNHSAP